MYASWGVRPLGGACQCLRPPRRRRSYMTHPPFLAVVRCPRARLRGDFGLPGHGLPAQVGTLRALGMVVLGARQGTLPALERYGTAVDLHLAGILLSGPCEIFACAFGHVIRAPIIPR